MADPLSVASGVAGLVSLTIQATQLACKYVAEVSHAGEAALQCLSSLSLLRDVLERISEAENSEAVTSVLNREPVRIPSEEIQRCTQSLQNVSQRLSALFRDDGKISKRKALVWPFQKSESANLIQQLQGFRDTFTAIAAADSLEVSSKTHAVVTDTLKDVRSIKTDVKAELEDRSARNFLDWILPGDAVHWHEPNNINTPSGAADWFLESDEFKDWLESSGELYWCHGAPGSGKTILMAQAIARTEKQFGPSPTMVLSHFCDHRDLRTQTPKLVIQHLIRQAALKDEKILAELYTCPEYLACKRNGRALRLHEAKRMLSEICLSNKRFVLVVDALDECAEEVDGAPARESLSHILKKAATAGTRVIVSSRQLNSIGDALTPCREAVIRAPDSELRSYVNMRLDGIEKRVPQAKGLQMAVVDKVVSNADGVYLVARLMIDMLAPTTIKNLRQIKKWLAHDSWNLSQMYQETLTRIMSSDENTADLARRVLLWLCYAQQSLTEAELQHALATELEDDDFDPDGITPGDFIRSACKGLVTRDDRGVYSLFHLTAYEFFRDSPELDAGSAHFLIAKTCMAYLSFSSMGRVGPCGSLEALEARNLRFALLDYAAKHWADHAKHVKLQVYDHAIVLLIDDTIRPTLVQSYYHRARKDEELRQLSFKSLPTGISPLQFACGRGLALCANKILLDGADVRRADDQGWTPLIAASSYGHLETVKLLLSHGPSTNEIGSSAPSIASLDHPSSQIVTGGHENLSGLHHSTSDMSRAVEAASIIEQSDRDGWSPLFWSIIKSHHSITEYLLASRASVTGQDHTGSTPLDRAAFVADSSAIALVASYMPQSLEPDLVSHGTQGYLTNQYSPIFLAAGSGNQRNMVATLDLAMKNQEVSAKAFRKLYELMDKMELHYGHTNPMLTSYPSVIMSDSFSVKLLECAIRSDQLTIVKMLVELGSPLGPLEREQKGRSPLHIAAFVDNMRICQYLISKGADISCRDHDMNTPLDLALLKGAASCALIFLRSSASTSQMIADGTAIPIFGRGLARASCCLGCIDSVGKPLIPTRSPSSNNMFDDSIDNVLYAYTTFPKLHARELEEIMDGVPWILEQLVLRGCDIDAGGPLGQGTVLQSACQDSAIDLMRHLLSQGANVNACDSGADPTILLACAADDNSFEMVKILRSHGADVNDAGFSGASPLSAACRSAPLSTIRLLVDHGADVNLRNKCQEHPLHIACGRQNRNNTPEIIEYLLGISEDGILSCERVAMKRTPFVTAMNAGNVAAMNVLLKHGAELPSQLHIRHALWTRASDPRRQIFAYICSLGADTKGLYGGETLITRFLADLSRKYDNADAFEEDLVALVTAGADINGLDECGRTPLTVARMKPLYDNLVQILMRQGGVEAEETKCLSYPKKKKKSLLSDPKLGMFSA